MKLHPYPRYRPSGADWPGDIPEHWGMKRLKMVADLIDRKITVAEDRSPPFVGMANVASWIGQLSSIGQVTPTGTANTFEVTHTLFGKLRPYLAKAWNPTFNGMCSTEFLVLNSTAIDRDLLLYVLLSDGFIREVDSSTYGSKMPRANWKFIGSRLLPLPPRSEQRAIVQFLDAQCASIDELVLKMQTLIERMTEQRSALISRIVTQGIQPRPTLHADVQSHTGFDNAEKQWLQNVPEHWDIMPLKRFHRIVNGGTPSSHEESFWGGDINWITPEDLGKNKSKIIGGSRRTLSVEGLANCSAQLVPRNSIVVSTRAPIGHIAIVSRVSCTNQGCRSLVTTDDRACADYMYYAICTSRHILESMGKGTTFMELSTELLGKHKVPVPPIDEQVAIAGFLDHETSKIDRIISRIETAVMLLREYRIALGTAAVSGSINVRSAISTRVGKHVDDPRQTTRHEQSVSIGTVQKEPKTCLHWRVREGVSIRIETDARSTDCVPVKPALLTWARERASYSLRQMSARFPNIAAWERGELQPTYRQLESFADTTHAPLGYFFLPEPPVEPMPIPDLRSVAIDSSPRPSPDLLDTIYHCQRQQNWYLEFVESEHASRLEFVGSAQVSDDIVETAVRMRKTLGIDLYERAGRFDCEDSFRSLIDHADAQGILVMLSGVAAGDLRRSLDPWEFRGLALADPLAPLVFVNGADTNAAQMFTLAREFAHLWLGVSGISDADLAGVPAHESEHWCNRVAAEVLVPADALRDELDPCASLQAELNRLSHRFEVSTLVLLRRIHDIGRLSRNEFEVAYSAELNRWKWMSKGGGGSPNLTVSGGVSRRFARALMVSTLEGHTGYTEALRLLGLKTMDSFDALRRNLEVGF